MADAQGGPGSNGAVAQFDALSGAQVGYIDGPGYELYYPGAFAVSGRHLFVGDEDSVTEMDAMTGALTGVVTGSKYQFESPGAMAIAGPDLFVLSSGYIRGAPSSGLPESWLTELDPSTGALVRVIAGDQYQFDSPDELAVSGHDLFVANFGQNNANPDEGGPDPGSVTEIDTSTGALVNVIGGWRSVPWDIDRPGAMAVSGPDLFVANWAITPWRRWTSRQTRL